MNYNDNKCFKFPSENSIVGLENLGIKTGFIVLDNCVKSPTNCCCIDLHVGPSVYYRECFVFNWNLKGNCIIEAYNFNPLDLNLTIIIHGVLKPINKTLKINLLVLIT